MKSNILVVEDDKQMHEIYRHMFKDSDYDVTYVRTAATALNKLKDKDYDLVILDIIMDPMPGDSFFIYLRNNPKTKNIPVVVVTVLKKEVCRRLEDINNVTFLEKPITKDQLLGEIKDRLVA